jgi:hypothetical protein
VGVKTVRFRDKEVVIGLNWNLLPPGQSESKAIRALLTTPGSIKDESAPVSEEAEASDDGKSKSKSKKKSKPVGAMEAYAGVKYGAVVKVPGNTVVGLPGPLVVNGKVKTQKKPRAPSAAAWLALANQAMHNEGNGSEQASGFTARHWAVVEALPDSDDYWLVAIKDQVPLPGTDVITTREEVLGMLNELIDAFGHIEIYSLDEGIRNQMPADCMVFPKGMAELVAKVKPGKAKLVQIRGVPPMVVGCILFLFVAGLGYWGWTEYEKKQAAIQAAALAKANKDAAEAKKSQEQKAYEQQVQQAILQALKDGVRDVQASVTSPAPSIIMQEWKGLFESTPISQASWAVTEVRCEMETVIKPSCVVNLQRGALGIDRMLRAAAPEVEIIDNNAAYWKHGQDKAERSYSWKELPLQEAFLLDLTSDAQVWRLGGLKLDIGKTSEIVSQVKVPPLPASLFKPGKAQKPIAAPSVQLGVAKGDLSLSGTGIWQAQGMLGLVDWPNASVTGWVINPLDQSWTMQVAYYVRSKPRPILPPVVLPDGQSITATLPREYDPEVKDEADSSATPPAAAIDQSRSK